jgi:hypothetical protein
MKTRTIGFVLISAIFLLFGANSFALTVNTSDIADGAVTTPKIADGAVTAPKIADGTVTDVKISGVISGSKLGTHVHNGSDIVDGTLSTSKISDSAVTTQKIVDGAVTDAKISGIISGSKLGGHVHNGSDIMDGTVSTSMISDGAVTDVKISGLISASKISSTGLNADTVDGKHSSDLALALHNHDAADIISGTLSVDRLSSYAGIKTVHKGPADGVNTFNTIVSALNAIGATSNRYAVIVMPGTYDEDMSFRTGISANNVDVIGQSRTGTIIRLAVGLQMREGVILKNLTIEGTVTFDAYGNNGLYDCIIKASDIGLSFNTDPYNVTIDNIIIEARTGIYMYNVMYPDKISLRNLQISGSLHGMAVDINSTLPLKISNATITGGTTGIQLLSGYIDIDNVSTKASPYDLYVEAGQVRGKNCRFNGQRISVIGDVALDNSIINTTVETLSSGPSKGAIKIGNSKIAGSIVSSGNIKIVNCYDANYDAIPTGVYKIVLKYPAALLLG